MFPGAEALTLSIEWHFLELASKRSVDLDRRFTGHSGTDSLIEACLLSFVSQLHASYLSAARSSEFYTGVIFFQIDYTGQYGQLRTRLQLRQSR